MLFITSKNDFESLKLANSLISHLKNKKSEYFIDKKSKILGNKKNIEEIIPKYIIAIGDDNLILDTIRSIGKRQIPLLGIASSPSFLAQTDSSNYKQAIDLILKKKYHILKRSRIVAKINDKKYSALNDIGIFPSKSASLMRYTLNLNDNKLWKDNADGLIISTPTGSTGYSYSAHGPIILDEPNILSITPISSLEKRTPTIISNKTKIKISEIQTSSPIVIMDGNIRVPLRNETLEIEKSTYDAIFIEFSKDYAIATKLKKRTTPLTQDKTKGLSPSAKFIHKILSYEGNLTQKEIITQSSLPERTVRHSLELLLKKRLITKHPYLNDARQTIYEV